MRVYVYLSEEPLAHTEFNGPGPSVEHQVQIGDPGEQVGRCQVPQQVVNGVMEASVHKDGHYDQDVSHNDEEAHGQSQTHHGIIPLTPIVRDNLPRIVVVKLNCIIGAYRLIDYCCHGESGHVGFHSPRGRDEAGIEEGRWCVVG